VIDYKDINRDAQERKLSLPLELPYFDGDFWTTILEDCIKVRRLYRAESSNAESSDAESSVAESSDAESSDAESSDAF